MMCSLIIAVYIYIFFFFNVSLKKFIYTPCVSLELIFFIVSLRAICAQRGVYMNNVYRSDRCNFTDGMRRWHRAKVQANRRDGEAQPVSTETNFEMR